MLPEGPSPGDPDPGGGSPRPGPDAERVGSSREGRRALLLLLALLAVIAAGSAVGRLFYGPRPRPAHEIVGSTMGTTYRVKVVLPTPSDSTRLAELADTVRSRLSVVESLMSTWDSASELSRFNRRTDTLPVFVSPPLLEVLLTAREVYRASGGAFDPTVGPLVEAWGFGPLPPGASAPPPPPDEVLDSLRNLVGYEKIRIDARAGTVARQSPGVELDLSAIAKGYGVDRVAEALLAAGVSDFAVEVGGEVRTHGSRPDGSAWRVAVEEPTPDARRLFGVIEMRDEAIATSGDYRNFHEAPGGRVAHIVDPRTGRPLRLRGFSVSVLSESTMLADAWATALTALGPERGLAVAEQLGLAALFVISKDGRFDARATPAFGERLQRPSGS